MSALLPAITIVMTTWMPDGPVGESRKRSSKRALHSWADHLRYDGPLHLHIADDGSSLPGALETLRELRSFAAVSSSRQERRGVGASLNAGMSAAFAVSPLALHAVDDWALTADLDVTPWAAALLACEDLGMIRLGPPHPDLTGSVAMVPDGWVLKLDRHHFADAMRPFLVHQRFFGAYGWYDEGISAYECERLHNLRYAHAADGPAVALALPHPWVHVGEVGVGEIEPEPGVLGVSA